MIRGSLAALLLLAAATTAVAQEEVRPHMEGCLVWNAQGNVMVRNDCSRPLALLFMDFSDRRVLAAELAPGARFTADSVWGQSGGFMFTACPAGWKPSVRFALESKEAIGVSLYNCLTGQPTS